MLPIEGPELMQFSCLHSYAFILIFVYFAYKCQQTLPSHVSTLCILWFISFLAAIARHIYKRPCVGVGALRKVYGGKY